MFGINPPPSPELAPTACPHCTSQEALALYATTRTAYYQCVACRHIRAVPLPAAADRAAA